MERNTKRSLILGGAISLATVLGGCGIGIFNGVGGYRAEEEDENIPPTVRVYEVAEDGGIGQEVATWDGDQGIAGDSTCDKTIVLPLNRGDGRENFWVVSEDPDGRGRARLASGFDSVDPLVADIEEGQLDAFRNEYLLKISPTDELPRGGFNLARAYAVDGKGARTNACIVGLVSPGETFPPVDSNGLPPPVEAECTTRYDCSADSLEKTCDSNGNAVETTTAYDCNANGQCVSNATTEVTPRPQSTNMAFCDAAGNRVQTTTDYVCENGDFVSNTTTSVNVKPADSYSAPFCDVNGNVSRTKTSTSCIDGVFTTSSTSDLVDLCNGNGCANAQCLTPQPPPIVYPPVSVKFTYEDGADIHEPQTLSPGDTTMYRAEVIVPSNHVGVPTFVLSEYVPPEGPNCFGITWREPELTKITSTVPNADTYDLHFRAGLNFGCPEYQNSDTFVANVDNGAAVAALEINRIN